MFKDKEINYYWILYLYVYLYLSVVFLAMRDFRSVTMDDKQKSSELVVSFRYYKLHPNKEQNVQQCLKHQ